MKIRTTGIIVGTALTLSLALVPAAAHASTAPSPSPAGQSAASAPLASPVDLTNAAQQYALLDEIERNGSATYTLTVQALPGAEVTIIVNGKASKVIADFRGQASVEATMVKGGNLVQLQQSLYGQTSELRGLGYSY